MISEWSPTQTWTSDGETWVYPEVGDRMPNYIAVDQFGDSVNLYDFAGLGKKVVLDMGTEYCGPCKAIASYLSTNDQSNLIWSRGGYYPWWKEEYSVGRDVQINGRVSPGNQSGGLANIFEKSLGSSMKGGTGPLMEVYKYAEPVTTKGFVFMDTPGFDPVSATGQIAGGANLVAFTTGRGSCFGAKPTPSIKLATNTPMFVAMEEDMDINCGVVLDGEATIEEMGQQIFEHFLRIASGEPTKSEQLGLGRHEFAPWPIGIFS